MLLKLILYVKKKFEGSQVKNECNFEKIAFKAFNLIFYISVHFNRNVFFSVAC